MNNQLISLREGSTTPRNWAKDCGSRGDAGRGACLHPPKEHRGLRLQPRAFVELTPATRQLMAHHVLAFAINQVRLVSAGLEQRQSKQL